MKSAYIAWLALFFLSGFTVNEAQANTVSTATTSGRQVSLKADASAVNPCERQVQLAVGERTVLGWVGDEVVSFVRRGMKVFGMISRKPVQLQIVGSEARGYQLQGEVDGDRVAWALDNQWVRGSLATCATPSTSSER